MKSAIVIAPIRKNLPTLPNEAQQVINHLSAAGYQVHLVQQPVTKIELFHAIDEGPFELGWVGTDSGEAGFSLSENEVIGPDEFGEFCLEAGLKDLVLNSCFSSQHVDAIQSKAKTVNVVATIVPAGIDDTKAWAAALFLVRRFVRLGGNLREAQRSTGAQYRWFPAMEERLGMEAETMSNQQTEDRLRRVELTVDQIARALQGESFTGQRGLIATIQEATRADEQWKREMERQINIVQDRITKIEHGREKMMLPAQTAVWLLVGSIVFVILVLAATRLFSGGGFGL